jgi:hypothetical protein
MVSALGSGVMLRSISALPFAVAGYGGKKKALLQRLDGGFADGELALFAAVWRNCHIFADTPNARIPVP